MIKKALSSNTLHAALIVFVMVAASFVLLVQTNVVSAQASDTQLVVGLQNPATSLNFFDVATNSVWKAYMLEYDFESLYTYDPASALYADLANNTAATNCPAGYTAGPYTGMCHDAAGFNFTVDLHNTVTFADPNKATPVGMTAEDVVFTYETLAWSTNAQVIYPALWWPQPIAPAWNSTANGGSCNPAAAGAPKYACMSHIAVWALNDYTVRFQLLPVNVNGVKGAYALFFYATLVVPIIPTYIWQNHMAGSALVNWSDPNGGMVSDTWDRSIDTTYSAAPATVGTGPFYLANYVQSSETTINVFTSYWGKGLSHTWPVGGTAYGFYPKYITSVRFVIFTSLDVVSLALQQGTIDTLVWSLTPGFYSQVQSNPAITVTSVTDSGFFYMSFNMRRQPWDDLCLRTAISKAIDKNYIVNTLMGGFGVPGNVPISIVNPSYVNATAAANAVTFDPTGIDPTLNACGYTVDPATGFYKAPASEGGQIVTATILTPPKDYDPVRADAGIMISKNLKAAGLNIASAPTSFDTIVARGLTFGQVDYDIYILGWSLGIFPETYICSFFCTNQDVQTNPAGSNSAGYSNAKVDSLINELTYTVNTPTRIQLMQDVEGIVTHDIPWNVLYYRKNLNAYRNDKFQGWQDNPVLNALSAGGGPFNFYSLVNLEPAGTVIPPGPTGTLSIATTIPQRVIANRIQQIPVYVSQNGAPMAGATVSVTSALANGLSLTSASATADLTGTAIVNWSVPVIQGEVFLTVSATAGSATGSTSKQLVVTVGPPAPMALLSLSTTTPVIAPGGTATVTASLVDAAGNPISGSTVHIDPTLLLGSISPASASTGASGTATFTYTAPAATLIPNAHQLDTINANVTVPGTIAAPTQAASLTIFVQNDATPAWTIISVQNTPAPGLVLGPTTGRFQNITVKATDWSGAAVSGAVIVPQFNESAKGNVTISPASVTTGASGLATFELRDVRPLANIATNITNVELRFSASGVLASVSDQVMLLVTDNVAVGHAARLTFTTRTMPYVPTQALNNVTANVVNELNASAAGQAVIFQISYGDLGIPAEFPMPYTYVNVTGTGGGYQNMEYGGTGLDLNSFGQGSLGGAFQNSTGPLGPYVPGAHITQGPGWGVENFVNDWEVVNGGNNYWANTTYDACSADGTHPPYAPVSPWPTSKNWFVSGGDAVYFMNATSVTDSAGQYTSEFYALPMPKDNGFQVTAYIGTAGELNVSADACAFVAAINHVSLKLDSGVVAQRAPGFALGSVTTTPTVVATSAARAISMTAHFYTLGGTAAGNDQVFLVRGQGSATRKRGSTLTTASDGTVTVSDTMPLLSLSQATYYAFLPADPKYAFGGREQLFSQTIGDFWIGPTFEVLIAKFPYAFQRGYLFIPTTVDFATATPANGVVAAGATTQIHVSVFTGATAYTPVSGASVWSGSFQATTDSGGNATFPYTAGLGASEGWVYVTTADGQVMRAWFGVMALNPILSYGTITPGVNPVGSDSTFSVTVTNLVSVAGTTTVVLNVDGNAVSAQQVTLTANGNTVVTFHYVFTSAGSHTITIGSATYTANVPAATSVLDTGTAYALAIGLLVVGVVAGVLVGMLLARRRKKPSMAMPDESMETKPAEEELPPEDKL